MAERELPPLEQAKAELPYKWYELSARAQMTAAIVSVLTISYPYIYFGPEKESLTAHLIGAGMYLIAGAVPDRVSTSKVIGAKNELRERGVAANVYESNILIKEQKSAIRYNLNPKTAISDIVGTYASAVSLGYAIPFLAIKIHASVNNFRVAKRLRRAIEISDQRAA